MVTALNHWVRTDKRYYGIIIIKNNYYLAAAARGCVEVAELAAAKKCEKYAEISTTHTFLPIAVETLGPVNESAYQFLMTSAEESATSPVTAAKHLSFTSDCRSPSNASMRLFIERHSFCTTIRISSHFTIVFRLFCC